MNKFADWFQIIGNFAIVGGLILVGVQVNQNTTIAQADMVARSYESVMQYNLAMLGENPVHAMATAATNPAELTDGDLLVLTGVAYFWMNLDYRTERIASMGIPIMDEKALEQLWRVRAHAIWGGNPVYAAFWKRARGTQSGESVRDWTGIVDEEFRTIDEYRGDAEYLMYLRNAAKGL